MASRPLGRRLRDALRYRLFRQNWNIGVVRAPVAVVAGLEGAQAQRDALETMDWMQEERGVFRADPFAVPAAGGGIDIYYERLAWSEGRGTIDAMTYDQSGFGGERALMRRPHHLSYPFTMQLHGEWVTIPEQAEARTVRTFPVPFDDAGTDVLAGEPLLDSTVVRHAGHFYLFATKLGQDENGALYLYHAFDLVGPWTPVSSEPVKVDRGSARPAGQIFSHGGELYRPGQNCARFYGESIAVNRIISLSPNGFEEEQVAEIRAPANSRYHDGLHTLSSCGGFTVIDGARLEAKLHPALDPLASLVR